MSTISQNKSSYLKFGAMMLCDNTLNHVDSEIFYISVFLKKKSYFVFCPNILLFHTAKARFTKICIFKLDVRDGD